MNNGARTRLDNPSISQDESSIEEVQMMVEYLNYDNDKYESEIMDSKYKMKSLIDKDNQLKMDHFLQEKQIELFNQELSVLQENFKDINWKINKDFCTNMLKVDKAPTIFLNMIETFLYTIDQPSTNLDHFKDLLKNFSNLKNIMVNVKEEDITQDKICRLMDLRKSSDNYESKLQSKIPGSELLLKWLNFILEIKLKKYTLKNIVEKMNSILEEKQRVNREIKELNNQILNMKLNLKNIKYSLKNIKSSRTNRLSGNISNMESPTKDTLTKKGELDICIEPKSKVISSKKEYSRNPFYDQRPGSNAIKDIAIIGSLNDNLNDNSNKSVLEGNRNVSSPIPDEIFLSALKQVKINTAPIENALKPLPKSDNKKGRNEQRNGTNSLSGTLSLNINTLNKLEIAGEINEGSINRQPERSVRASVVLESQSSKSKCLCSKQISNFFC